MAKDLLVGLPFAMKDLCMSAESFGTRDGVAGATSACHYFVSLILFSMH
jgi:hypothetical protein